MNLRRPLPSCNSSFATAENSRLPSMTIASAPTAAPRHSFTRDPIGYAGGIGLYSALGNSPLVLVDPDGKKPRTNKRPPEIPNTLPLPPAAPNWKSTCGAGWEVAGKPPSDPRDGMGASGVGKVQGWHWETLPLYYDKAQYGVEFSVAPSLNSVRSSTCGRPHYAEFQVTFNTEVSIGIGGTYENFSASASWSVGLSLAQTWSVQLPGEPCTQFKAVPILQRLVAQQAHYYLGDYDSPGPDGVHYFNYSSQSRIDLGYIPQVFQLHCKAKWEKSNGSGLFDLDYKRLHRSDSDGFVWRAGSPTLSFGTMPMQAQLRAQ